MAIGIGTILLATAVGGGTYLFAKSKKANNGSAAVAGVATGAGTAAAMVLLSWLWPVLLVVGVIGVPAYYIGKGAKERKALGPGSD